MDIHEYLVDVARPIHAETFVLATVRPCDTASPPAGQNFRPAAGLHEPPPQLVDVAAPATRLLQQVNGPGSSARASPRRLPIPPPCHATSRGLPMPAAQGGCRWTAAGP